MKPHSKFHQELLDAINNKDYGKIEDLVDIGLRHKPKTKDFPFTYLEQWLKVGRCFAYATQDDSYGEFEKLFAIIIKKLMKAEYKLGEYDE